MAESEKNISPVIKKTGGEATKEELEALKAFIRSGKSIRIEIFKPKIKNDG